MDRNGPRMKQAREAMASLDVLPVGLTGAGPGTGTGTGRGRGVGAEDDEAAAGFAGKGAGNGTEAGLAGGSLRGAGAMGGAAGITRGCWHVGQGTCRPAQVSSQAMCWPQAGQAILILFMKSGWHPWCIEGRVAWQAAPVQRRLE